MQLWERQKTWLLPALEPLGSEVRGQAVRDPSSRSIGFSWVQGQVH